MTQKATFSFLKFASVTLLAIIISMGGFWLTIGQNLVTRAEARTMINEGTSSIRTELIFIRQGVEKLDERMIRQEEEFRQMLKENTTAINDLRIQLASLTKTIESLSESIGNKQ